MYVLLHMPMKFECTHCNHCYFHSYRLENHHYPTCPDYHQAGRLLGLVEFNDLIQHPMFYATRYFKQTWHKLKKLHS